MEDRKEVQKVDIYSEAIKTILAYHKRSLLDFIDAIERVNGDPRLKDVLGRIKGRVHNDLSQCTLNLGILLATIQSGGNIKPFEDNLIFRKDDSRRHFDRPSFKGRETNYQKPNYQKPNYQKPNNPVINKEQADGIKDKL